MLGEYPIYLKYRVDNLSISRHDWDWQKFNLNQYFVLTPDALYSLIIMMDGIGGIDVKF